MYEKKKASLAARSASDEAGSLDGGMVRREERRKRC
jgi:hypothetical protein